MNVHGIYHTYTTLNDIYVPGTWYVAVRTNAPTGRVDRIWAKSGGKAP